MKVVLVTSSVGLQGKSTVTANLARTLAELGRKTFLVEGDLRHPVLDGMLRHGNNGVLESGNGFSVSELPTGQAEFSDTTVRALSPVAEQPNLYVIAGGNRAVNPPALLASAAMAEFIDYIRTQSDMALVSSPPVLNISDTSVLAPKADGALLVVRQSSTRRGQLLAAINQLQASRARLLGFVFVKNSRKAGTWV